MNILDAATKANFRSFEKHLETATTRRKLARVFSGQRGHHDPNLRLAFIFVLLLTFHQEKKHEWPRTLALSVVRVRVSRHPELEQNASRQKAERLVKHLLGFSKSCQDGLALSRSYLPARVDNLKNPLTLEDEERGEQNLKQMQTNKLTTPPPPPPVLQPLRISAGPRRSRASSALSQDTPFRSRQLLSPLPRVRCPLSRSARATLPSSARQVTRSLDPGVRYYLSSVRASGTLFNHMTD